MDGTIERGPYGAQYLVSGLSDSVETAYQMDIMMHARPEFLLPVHRQATARGSRYAYPVTGLDSLADRVAAGTLDRKQAVRIVQQLRQDLERLYDHLLTPEQILLRPEALFLEPAAGRLLLVYRPFLPADGSGTMDALVTWLGERLCRNRWQQRRWAMQTAAEPAKEARADPNVADPDCDSAPLQTTPTDGSRKRRVILLCVAGAAAVAALAFTAAATGVVNLSGLPLSGLPQSSLPLPSLETLGSNLAEPTQSGPHNLKADWRLVLLALLILSIPVQLILWNRRHRRQAEPPSPGEDADWIQTWKTRLDPAPLVRKTIDAMRRKSEASPASQERMHDMPTQLLSSRQELFRLATISEGMLGTTAETAGQRAFILNDEFLVGRDFRTVDLCLTGYAIGRQHARITRQGAAFFITDLGSKNGTRLDGERLNKMQPYLLPDRCQLQFADRLFYFEAEQLPVGA